jgi:outer membrane lipase/esterase
MVGGAVSVGTADFDFGSMVDGRPTGGFEQEEWAVSLYAAARLQNVWFDVIGTYGRLDYDITRLIPMGIVTREVDGSTDGTNWSVASQVGYDFKWAGLTHGPVAGLTYQHVNVDGFVEIPNATTPSYLALTFGDQTRTSLVGALGWRASWDLGMFQPFAKAVWKHEFMDDERSVTATLTQGSLPTLVGPLSYSLPAVEVGRDWAAVTLGTEVKFGPEMSGVISGTGAFGQDDVAKYGVQVGLRLRY